MFDIGQRSAKVASRPEMLPDSTAMRKAIRRTPVQRCPSPQLAMAAPSATPHSTRRMPREKSAFVAFLRRSLRRPTGLAVNANRPDFEHAFGRTPAALHLASFLRPHSYFRIVGVLFTSIIE